MYEHIACKISSRSSQRSVGNARQTIKKNFHVSEELEELITINKKHNKWLLDRNTPIRENYNKLIQKIKHEHKKTGESGRLVRDSTDKGRRVEENKHGTTDKSAYLNSDSIIYRLHNDNE